VNSLDFVLLVKSEGAIKDIMYPIDLTLRVFKIRELISRKQGKSIAHSWVLTTSLTNKYLASIGYDDIYKRYEVLHSNH